jgi:hypothetical protein
MAICDDDGTDVDHLPVDGHEAHTDPSVVCPFTVEVADECRAPNEPPQERGGVATIPVRHFRCIDAIQANRNSSYDDRVGIAHVRRSPYLTGHCRRRQTNAQRDQRERKSDQL